MLRFLFILTAFFTTAAFAKTDMAEFSRQATLRFGVVSNFDNPGHFKAYVELNNLSQQSLPSGESNWQIYIHSTRRVSEVLSDEIRFERVQGDLYRLTPTGKFNGLQPGDKKRIEYIGRGEIASYAYFMPRAFIVDANGKAFTFQNTDTEDYSQFVDPLASPQQYLRFNQPDADLYGLSSQDSNFAKAYDVKLTEVATPILPSPKSVKLSDKAVTIDASWTIYQPGGFGFESRLLQQKLASLEVDIPFSQQAEKAKTIQFVITPDIENQGYELSITDKHIRISASDATGIFYAVQSLISLIDAAASHGAVSLQYADIHDAPRYEWRGMHYDIARNFHGKHAILTLLDEMARLKLNKLHLHLTDDEGWRLEIPGLPELTRVGANRCFDLDEQRCLLTQLGEGPEANHSGSGSLSRSDFVEIIKFAAQRHIEVIPEVDMPGHARAAIVAMKARYQRLIGQGQKQAAEQYLLSDPEDSSHYLTVQSYSDNSVNPCMDSTFQFIEKVMYEVQSMYREAGQQLTLFHIGGDEVGKGSWTASPACNRKFAELDNGLMGVDDVKPYFVNKVANIAQQRGMAIGGWEDGLMYDRNNPFMRNSLANDNVVAFAWDNIWEAGVADRAYKLANAGYDVVLSSASHLYFDHPYEASPFERGYHWATRFSDLNKVFSFQPDNLYLNASRTLSGQYIDDLDQFTDKYHERLINADNVLGMQGQLWSETIRNETQMQKMVFPRLVALAERAWHKAEWEGHKNVKNTAQYKQDWQRFISVLYQHVLPGFIERGVAFYLPAPRVGLQNGKVTAKPLLPFLSVEFSCDNGKNWQAGLEANCRNSQQTMFRTAFKQRYSRLVNASEVEFYQ
ncbi:family 20 glycosylhydrolase [Neptunicella marina]|uniref:beta-N-acetylhexosaminidase n=1 Tax=Neptunicella marina TaxID=2125989 RepID=A0A8J6IYJ6_9ALTE|nr:family 20 glycosylhydrolase [Neptunicella marina]MBC3767448.1 carbohydate-binding domain-containing protein [Neptunicella marina]